ncbi:ATP-binding protein [Pseudoflavonifractor phocaeensis]|uniref:ATP-binding protein n=1 Tax=Pseudoflavonifractor phocaeensis TaxID=1870988 RepID=UPI0025A33E18|nr:ATP-binding protein [Pseudoflavonifractor phocaeensis]MDM8240132.1 ATP-binding protein [Pseudoflavonifractor phocaeensis]
MLPVELLELTKSICKQKAETQTLELKSAHVDCPKRLYDTLSSFSNQDSGGILLFGIDEGAGYQVVGVYDPQDLQKKVTEQCNQMEPKVRAVFTLAEWQEGIWICSAEIPGLDLSERPCYYQGAGRIKGSFLRVGDADLPMTDYELYSYEAFRKHQHDDERPVERATLDMMERDKLDSYLLQRRIERPGFAQLTQAQAYEMLNITRDGVPTLAGVLNFALYPQGYFPQLGITAIVVPGTQIGDTAVDSARFINNKRIEGTIPAMAEEALSFCQRNMKVRTIIDKDTGKRTDRTEYPMDAIREAVLNALIHRDYSIYTEGTPIQIDFFTDRLEIHSPGSLYGRMTVEQLGVARPDLRNPALAVMTEVLTGAENRYSGIPTIRRAMAEYGLPEPKFENRRNEFVVTLYNGTDIPVQPETSAEQSSGEPDLLAFCKTPRSRQEIADYLGVKTVFYVMQHYVKPLLESGQLVMTIPEKPKSRKQKYFTKQ